MGSSDCLAVASELELAEATDALGGVAGVATASETGVKPMEDAVEYAQERDAMQVNQGRQPMHALQDAVVATEVMAEEACEDMAGVMEEAVIFGEDEEVGLLADRCRRAALLQECTLGVPGRRVHIYCWRGHPQAVYAPRDHPSFHRVELYANMLEDHKHNQYIRALQAVLRARRLRAPPRQWQPFKMDAVCACCQHDFTWASTSHSLAQQCLDRHHCHGCGRVVCGECSKHTSPHIGLGLYEVERVCDICYLDPFDGANL